MPKKTKIIAIRNAGKVMVEILNVPDDIPQDILDKAECVIVLPSVVKAALRGGREFPFHPPPSMDTCFIATIIEFIISFIPELIGQTGMEKTSPQNERDAGWTSAGTVQSTIGVNRQHK